ncbi:ECF RNA polymerase sigma factor SigK [Millisia brevis]|uniref:ECF RNA polymerase sigma factor SigK n=1 Tax=Millisia brevis TaxID=264148 RepID=UPI000829639A|nr:ECF RNA polymerase sigma factor SigK [Millisia brevis]
MTDVGEGAEVLETLMARIVARDRDAFARLYDLTSAVVYGTVLRVLRDPGYSEETVQETYLQAWRHAERYDASRGSVSTWLVTMAHRRAVDRVRSEQSRGERDLRANAPERAFDAVAEAVVVRDDRRRVADCLDSLTDLQRQSVELAYYRGLTYREVAENLSVTLPTVKTRIRDGLQRLKSCLGVGRDDG